MGKYDDLFDVAPTPTPTPAPGKYADLFDTEPTPSPTPTAVASTDEGDGFLAKINAALRKPSPEFLQAPEGAVRELIQEQMPHDLTSYLEQLYPPAYVARQTYNMLEPLTRGDVRGIPGIGRIPEIAAADETPAFSKERYKTALKTLLDVGMLAGAGERAPLPREALPIEQPPIQAEAPPVPPVEVPPPPIGTPLKPVPSVDPSGGTSAANAAAAAEPAGAARASVPVMITRQMEADLRAAGLSQAEINALTPQAAHDILTQRAAPQKGPVQAPGGVPPVAETPPVEPPIVEPVPPTPEGGGLRVTSTKNAVVDQERVARGLSPILSEVSRTAPELVRQAEARVTENPRYPEVLIKELATGEKTALDPVDEAVLLTHKTTLQNAKAKAGDRALDASRSEAERALARAEFDDLEGQLQIMDVATRRGGTLWSEQGRFRQQLMAEDYSLVALEQKLRIAKGGKPLTPEESAKLKSGVAKLNSLQTKIAQKNARLEEEVARRKGLLPPRPERAAPIPGDWETEALQTELAKLKAEERFSNALPEAKARITKRIAELQARMAEYGFAEPTKRVPVEPDAELRRLQYEYSLAKADLDRGIFQARLKNRSLPARIWQTGREMLALPRALMASTDLSAVLRQGGFIFMGNPIRSLRNFAPMLKAAASRQGYFEVMQEIRQRPNGPLYQSSGLGLTDIAAPKLSQMEEIYMSRWAEAIPIVNHSQRAYVAFLNRLRADSFDAMAKTLSRDGEVTPQQAKDLSNFINVFSGRGTFSGKYEQAAAAMNEAFFAPRYLVSRFQALMGHPIWSAKDPLARRLIAKEYAKTLIGFGVLYSLASTALKQFATVEWDPRSSDFGKIKIGNTRIDPMAGLAQTTVVSARLGATLAEKLAANFGYNLPIGKIKTPGGVLKTISGGGFADTTASEVAARFLRSKLAPVPAAVFNLWDGKDYIGDPTALIKTEKEFPWLGGEIPRLLAPLAGSDIYDAMKEQGVPAGAALGVLAIFGDGLQTYSARVPPQQLPPTKLSMPKEYRLPTLRQQFQKLQSKGP